MRLNTLLYVLFCLWLVSTLSRLAVEVNVNKVRGDEFFSFVHSNPDVFSFSDVCYNIKQGADHSYVHAGLLWICFKVFGYTLYVQRMLSLFAWLICIVLAYLLCKQFQISSTGTLLGIVLIFGSNTSITIATDGRFYTLVCLMAIVQAMVTHTDWSTSIKGYVWFFILQMIAYLISPILVFSHMINLIILVGKENGTRRVIPITLGMIGFALYYLLWRVEAFDSYLSEAHLMWNPGFYSHPEIYSWPFRWVTLFNLPWIGDILDGIVTAVAMGILIVWFRRSHSHTESHKPLWGLLLFLILISVAASLQLFFGNQVWPIRYFAFGFFWVGIGICYMADWILSSQRMAWLMAFGMILLLNRSVSDWQKIPDRAEQLKQLQVSHDMRYAYCECEYDQYTELQHFGEVYVRFPDMRQKLIFYYKDLEPLRTAYFKRLTDMSYPVNFRMVP